MIELKKGDYVTATWGVDKKAKKIALKPKFKSRVLYLTLEDSKGNRSKEMLAQWFRPSTDEEVLSEFGVN